MFIINKEVLQKSGACSESIKHFVEIVGNGNDCFSIEYKDAMRYLIKLSKEDPVKYAKWPGFILRVKQSLEIT